MKRRPWMRTLCRAAISLSREASATTTASPFSSTSEMRL